MSVPATSPRSGPAAAPSGPITRDQWLVLVAAFLGWLFDGFEIGLFPVVARPALMNLLGGANDAAVGPWMAWVTASFLLGAACGGVLFGWLGDRVGRVRALSLSILTYSLFTGLGVFATQPWHLCGFRFIASLGMGGEWALGVALVMECWPERWRPYLAGAIGAAANFGFLLTGLVARIWPVTQESWRWMFLVGAAPALLVFFIRLFVPESERWRASVIPGTSKLGPIREVFRPPLLRHTVLAIVFASVALIGTWGSVQWIPLWVDQMVGGINPGAKAEAQMAQAVGAIIGASVAPLVGAWLGRRISFFILCSASLVLTGILFRTFDRFDGAFLAMTLLVSMATASFYGWFPLYFPELFPTRVRATGQGLSYNFGRVFAAGGALVQGQLVAAFDGSYARAGAIVTLVYLVGMALIWLAPETKNKPLPD